MAYNNRGIIYSKQGNFTQAMSDYNKAIEINPEFAQAYNNRGLFIKPYKACLIYNKAIEINPKNARPITIVVLSIPNKVISLKPYLILTKPLK